MSRLRSLPFIGSFISHLEQDIARFDFPTGCRMAVKRTGTRLSIKGRTDRVSRVLEKEATVVIANHPYEADALVLIASLVPRRDVFLIMNHTFTGVSKEIDKQLVPVYIRHHIKKQNKRNYLNTFLQLSHPSERFTPEEEHEKNRESIRKASQLLEKGALVIIFPGRRSVTGSWFSGVGHLLSQAKGNKKLYVVKAYIEHTSNWDYLRFIPGFGHILPTISVSFAEPLAAQKLLEKSPKEITHLLEENYEGWLNSLKGIK
jgi:1-acyl-sn-glycerol-3-phosphate acyltransferase